MIAHAGDSNDLDYLRELADTRRQPRLRPLLDRALQSRREPDRDADGARRRGLTDRIHLGHDAACFYDFMAHNPPFAHERPDYLHISTKIVPALLANGVTQAQIDQMLVDNPRRFFSD